MAQGTVTLFEEFSKTIGDGTHDLDTHVIKFAMITSGVVPTAADATPALGDYTEISAAGGYTSGGLVLTCTWVESNGSCTFDASGLTFSQNSSGPSNICYGLIYNDTAASDEAICFIDMTEDAGATPISLAAGDITFTPHASGIFKLS